MKIVVNGIVNFRSSTTSFVIKQSLAAIKSILGHLFLRLLHFRRNLFWWKVIVLQSVKLTYCRRALYGTPKSTKIIEPRQ